MCLGPHSTFLSQYFGFDQCVATKGSVETVPSGKLSAEQAVAPG